MKSIAFLERWGARIFFSQLLLPKPQWQHQQLQDPLTCPCMPTSGYQHPSWMLWSHNNSGLHMGVVETCNDLTAMQTFPMLEQGEALTSLPPILLNPCAAHSKLLSHETTMESCMKNITSTSAEPHHHFGHSNGMKCPWHATLRFYILLH